MRYQVECKYIYIYMYAFLLSALDGLSTWRDIVHHTLDRKALVEHTVDGQASHPAGQQQGSVNIE